MVVGPQDVVLSARGLGFAYGPAPVLEGVDLDLRPGELVGVVGPNGSGKSTLLGLLCGLLAPGSGSVGLKGRDIGRYRRAEVARVVGLVPQTPELNPGLTVLEAVLSGRFSLMGRRLFEDREDEAAAERALIRTGLTDLAGRPAGELSGGERQRLALARAYAAEPEVLLLDEPTSALDLDHQLRTMTDLETACRRDGLAVCLVSHDLNLAGLFCDRLLLLSRGRTLAQGRPAEVLTPELISSAFRVETLVDREPVRGRPRVTLVPPRNG